MDGRMLGSKEVTYVKGRLLLSKGWYQCWESRATTSTYKAIYRILSPNPRTWGKILIMPMLFMALMLMACGTIWKRKLLKKCKEVFGEKEGKKNLSQEDSQQKGLETAVSKAGGRGGVGSLVCSECLIGGVMALKVHD